MGGNKQEGVCPYEENCDFGLRPAGSIVADAIASGLLPDYTLCAAMSRKLPDAEALCAKAGGAACVTLDEVLAQKPDVDLQPDAVGIQ